ncbi:MAG: hypothetical protein VR69_08375 [Peptococcaceae bacterium BRH_c4b]|nr:MAG: hypothetical protein VR69_08375 [Peptococcaceae bacterium BRH_c4b]
MLHTIIGNFSTTNVSLIAISVVILYMAFWQYLQPVVVKPGGMIVLAMTWEYITIPLEAVSKNISIEKMKRSIKKLTGLWK